MDLTWFELRPAAIEIGARLRGYYINNVYRSGPHALTLRLRSPEGGEALLIVHTRRAAWIAESAPRLEMDDRARRLRDHLLRLRISGAAAVRNERIIEIVAEPDRRIYAEFFGVGNLVVVSGGRVEAALNSVKGRSRDVSPGAPYELPKPRRSIFEAGPEELAEALRTGRPLNRALGSAFLAPTKYLEEALWRSGLEPTAPAESVAPADLERLAEELSRMGSELESATSLYLYRGDGVLEVSAIRLRRLEEIAGASPELHESPSSALDAALRAELTEEEGGEGAGAPEEIRRLEQVAEEQEARARSLSERASSLRALAARLASGELGLEDALRSLEGDAEVRLVGRQLLLGDTRVSTDNPQAVSSALYGYAKRLESAASSLLSRAAEIRDRLGRLELAPPLRPDELKVREVRWYERHRWFLTSGGLLAVGGRDASGNSALVRRHLEPGDLVFHAEIAGSPFFILKGGRSSARAEDLEEVAQATVSFSRAWREGLAAADAYYVYPEQVSASAPSGEYLPRGSFMIRGPRNYVRGLRLEVAVGLCSEPDGGASPCSGPRRSVDERGLVYILLEPGHMRASDVASKAVRIISDHLPQGLEGLRGGLRVDDFLRLLPPGGSRIVGIARGKRLREVRVG